jgi:hypothetical protein
MISHSVISQTLFAQFHSKSLRTFQGQSMCTINSTTSIRIIVAMWSLAASINWTANGWPASYWLIAIPSSSIQIWTLINRQVYPRSLWSWQNQLYPAVSLRRVSSMMNTRSSKLMSTEMWLGTPPTPLLTRITSLGRVTFSTSSKT